MRGFFLTLTALFLTAIDCYSAVAPPPIDAVETNETHRYTVKLKITDGKKEIPAFVQILDEKGRDAANAVEGIRFIAAKGAVFRLFPGTYRVIVSAGPRYTVWKSYLQVINKDLSFEVVLEGFFKLPENRWSIIDPYISKDYEYSTNFYLADVDLRMHVSGVDICGLESFPIIRKKTARSNIKLRNLLSRLLLTRSYFDGSITALTDQRKMTVESTDKDIQQNIFKLKNKKNIFIYWSDDIPSKDFFYLTCSGPVYDGIDITASRFNKSLWFNLLKMGFRIPAVGGGPSLDDENDLYPSAAMYLRKLQFDGNRSTLSLLREGRSCVGKGPFINFTINGKGPGDSIGISDRTRNVSLTAFSSSAHTDSIRSIDLIYNGKVIETLRGLKDQRSIDAGCSAQFPDTGWVIARYNGFDPGYWAVTNPLYVGLYSESTFRQQTTELSVKAEKNKISVPCILEVWDKGAFLGKFTIPLSGKTLTFPSTALIKVFDAKGTFVNSFSLYAASGAELYVKTSAMEKSRLAEILLSPHEYIKVANMMKRAKVIIDIK
ncbi:MAG: CehA/McbA family metallohydrolase domain-containing protein [Planctomycetota bacterium]|jgi:hypothetical protein